MNEISITLDGKEYLIDVQKGKELGILKEKDTRCKSWKAFEEKYRKKQGLYYDEDNMKTEVVSHPYCTNEQLTEKEAIAIKAFAKLLKLRRDWVVEWDPDWSNLECKYCIVKGNNSIIIACFFGVQHTFSFPTEKMAKEFFDCFKDLFEQCKNLI